MKAKSVQMFMIMENIKKTSLYFLSVIFIASAFPIGKNYYALVFLEECKYIFIKKDKQIH